MIHIIIHILPQEIDQLEALMIHLKRSSLGLPPDAYHVEVQLNMNLTDWEKSALPRIFFVDKLLDSEELTKSWATTEFNWSTNGSVMGCNDARRNAIRKSKADWIMYLDADNIFSERFTYLMHMTTHAMKEDGFKVILPEVTRMWDSTWDVITNKEFMNEKAGHEYYDVRDPYKVLTLENTDPHLRLIGEFKFAGWGTTFPTKLARIVDIPDSLGPYGVDDTFLMHGFELLKSKGYDIQQYVIENEVIIENNKFRFNPYKSHLVSIDRRKEYLANAHKNFNTELKKLNERLSNQRSN